MRKILIPTDFSENAINALMYAVEFFKYEKSVFYIMHAYQDDIYADSQLLNKLGLEKVTTQVREHSELQLEHILNIIKEISPNPRHKYRMLSANNLLMDEADKIVDDKNIDIIVMGTRGKTNNNLKLLGSHTLQVLKYVQCPVLAIPEKYKYQQPKHILFPTNFVIPYKRRELKLLCEMACPYRAVIDVVYISTSEKLSLRQIDNMNFIKEELHKTPTHFKTVKSKRIINSIYKYIKQNRIDMLVMVNTRHSFLENILFHSGTIDELSLNLDIPFLALQNMRRP